MSGRVRVAMPVAEFSAPSMLIDDLNAPMNDAAIEGQPWYKPWPNACMSLNPCDTR
jgi:hypothetical protein